VAKVMISIPDELLADLDRAARGRATTRSGLIRELVGEHLRREDEDRLRDIRRLLAAARPHDGRGAEHVRADRTR